MNITNNMEKKYKLKVLYGSEACDYADEHTYAGAVKKVKKGELDGSYCEYKFDTEEDMNTAKEMIADFDGWNDYWTETE